MVRLVSSQPFRHFRWIDDMVPVQLHGEIKGLKPPLSSTSSEPQHILHWGYVVEEFIEFALTNTLFVVYSCFVAFAKAIWCCYFLIKIDDCYDWSSPPTPPNAAPSTFSNWSLFLCDWLPYMWDGFLPELTISKSTSLMSIAETPPPMPS